MSRVIFFEMKCVSGTVPLAGMMDCKNGTTYQAKLILRRKAKPLICLDGAAAPRIVLQRANQVRKYFQLPEEIEKTIAEHETEKGMSE